jgi:hypothetical protein
VTRRAEVISIYARIGRTYIRWAPSRLVRGKSLIVAAVLVPIEVAGDSLTDLATHLAQSLLGHSLLSEWLADTITNVAFTPFYAVAAVLLTVDLIHEKGGGAELHSKPAS